MLKRPRYINLIYFPLKVQALAEAPPASASLSNLLQRSLDTPDWSLEQLWQVAIHHHLSGAWHKALSYYQRLMEWSEHDSAQHGEAMGATGHVLLQMRKYDDARTALEIAVRKAPQALRAPFFLSSCYEVTRRFQEALTMLARFIEGYPYQDMLLAEAVGCQARLYDLLGEFDSARSALRAGAERLKSWGFAYQAATYQPLLNLNSSKDEAAFPLNLEQFPHLFGPELLLNYSYRKIYTVDDFLSQLSQDGQQLTQAVRHSFAQHVSFVEAEQHYAPQRQVVIIGDFSCAESYNYHELIVELARKQGITVICAGSVPELFRQEDWMSLYPTRNSLPYLRDAVLSQRPQLLIYAGLSPSTPQLYALATQQLAPHQAVLGSFPTSSGLSSVQSFLSFDWLESPQAEAYYSEQLVRLSGSPLSNVSLPDRFISRSAFKLPDTRRSYFCPVAVSHHHRDYRALLAQILEQDSEGQILLPSCSTQALDRLYHGDFRARYGTLADRLFFLPPLNESGLTSLIREVDLVLDPSHVGIAHSSWRLLLLGTPTVTWEAPWAHGRYLSALYRRLGLEESVVTDLADYAPTAARLAQNAAALKEHYRTALASAEQRSRLFNFEACLQGIREFIEGVLQQQPASSSVGSSEA